MILISSSMTEESVLITQGYNVIPKKISFLAYRYLFLSAGNIFNAYGVTLFVTFVGVILGLTLIIMLSYALSIKDLPGGKVISFLVFFSMLFNGGLVSTYLMYTGIFHIKNTIWALIIPFLLVNPFLVMLARSFFVSSIPSEISEAARVDGSSELRLFAEIILPMAMPIIATVGLMIGLSYWNNWTNGLYFVTKSNLYSVQQLLNQLLMSSQGMSQAQMLGADVSKSIPSTGLKMATAVVGVIPIMIIYPFFQKFFIKGIAMGAVKG